VLDGAGARSGRSSKMFVDAVVSKKICEFQMNENKVKKATYCLCMFCLNAVRPISATWDIHVCIGTIKLFAYDIGGVVNPHIFPVMPFEIFEFMPGVEN
jgi:hypothetical protein